MKLKEWAKEQGISYITAFRWFHAGKMPVPTIQTETGMILVQVDRQKLVEDVAAVYGRVSSSGQKGDLDRQVARLTTWCAKEKLKIGPVLSEVGSGMNGSRRGLKRLLRGSGWNVLVVEHRDRLTRFGFEYIEAALLASGRRIVVLDVTEVKDDLVRDMTEVLTSFCARLYGKRSAKARAKKAVEATGT